MSEDCEWHELFLGKKKKAVTTIGVDHTPVCHQCNEKGTPNYLRLLKAKGVAEVPNRYKELFLIHYEWEDEKVGASIYKVVESAEEAMAILDREGFDHDLINVMVWSADVEWKERTYTPPSDGRIY